MYRPMYNAGVGRGWNAIGILHYFFLLSCPVLTTAVIFITQLVSSKVVSPLCIWYLEVVIAWNGSSDYE
jgi:hypothetical protein